MVVFLADLVVAVVSYVLTDMLRCGVRMHTAWPEVVPDYGSTIWVHLRMLAVVVVVWPLILRWMGLYRRGDWPWQWQVRRVAAASVLLALSMGAYAMLVERAIYPRAQIAYLMLLLPGATWLVRRFAGPVGRGSGPGGEK